MSQIPPMSGKKQNRGRLAGALAQRSFTGKARICGISQA